MCIYNGVGELTDLKETQLKISKEFKKVCEDFSKYKRLTRIIFVPCQNKDENSTNKENFEFLLNYDENNDFINKEDIKKYLSFYTYFKTAEKIADLQTKYKYKNEFSFLILKTREVIENIENSRITVVRLSSKLIDLQIIYLNSKNLSTFYKIRGILCSSALNLVVIYFTNSYKIKKIDNVITKIKYISPLDKKKYFIFIFTLIKRNP